MQICTYSESRHKAEQLVQAARKKTSVPTTRGSESEQAKRHSEYGGEKKILRNLLSERNVAFDLRTFPRKTRRDVHLKVM